MRRITLVKCKHDWRFDSNLFELRKYYCTKCLAQAILQIKLDIGEKPVKCERTYKIIEAKEVKS
jgi:hypothetical protein